MRILMLAMLSVICATAENRTVEVNVTSSASLPADQAVFGVAVRGPADLTIDRAVAAVQGLGLGAGNLVGVSTATAAAASANTPTLQLQYDFSLTVPVSQLTTIVSTLQTTGTDLQKRSPELQLGFQLSQFAPSAAKVEEARQKALPDLVSQARQRALLVAAAGGGSLGAVKALRDSSYTSGANYFNPVSSFAAAGSTTSSYSSVTTSAQQVTFSLQVVYDLQ